MRTVLILVDALRHDRVTASRMPFTAGLAADGVLRTIRDTFGFVGIRAAVFHGARPVESGMVFLYQRAARPSESEFHWLRFMPRVLWSSRTARRLQRVWNMYRHRFRRRAVSIWDLSSIPLDLLPHFRHGEPHSPLHADFLPGRPSVLDGHRPEEVLYLGYPCPDQRTTTILDLCRQGLDGSTRFAYLHFAELDWEQHRVGPDGESVTAVARQIDAAIAAVHELCQRRWREPFRFIIFGDHGSVEVRETVDIEGLLGLDPARPATRRGLDYFVDSTMVRFWFEGSDREAEIRHALGALGRGRIVTPDDLPALGCEYDRDIFGDLFYCLDEGLMFAPSFFHRGTPPRGMHGYLPGDDGADENDGALVMNVEGGETPDLPDRILEMTDLYEILRGRTPLASLLEATGTRAVESVPAHASGSEGGTAGCKAR